MSSPACPPPSRPSQASASPRCARIPGSFGGGGLPHLGPLGVGTPHLGPLLSLPSVPTGRPEEVRVPGLSQCHRVPRVPLHAGATLPVRRHHPQDPTSAWCHHPLEPPSRLSATTFQRYHVPKVPPYHPTFEVSPPPGASVPMVSPSPGTSSPKCHQLPAILCPQSATTPRCHHSTALVSSHGATTLRCHCAEMPPPHSANVSPKCHQPPLPSPPAVCHHPHPPPQGLVCPQIIKSCCVCTGQTWVPQGSVGVGTPRRDTGVPERDSGGTSW